jgi:hypothetical protein
MIAQVGAALAAALMLKLPWKGPPSIGASVTLAGTVTDGLLLDSWTTAPVIPACTTCTVAGNGPPPAMTVLFEDTASETGPGEFVGLTNSSEPGRGAVPTTCAEIVAQPAWPETVVIGKVLVVAVPIANLAGTVASDGLLLKRATLTADKDAEFRVTVPVLELPLDTSVGETLTDCTVTIASRIGTSAGRAVAATHEPAVRMRNMFFSY